MSRIDVADKNIVHFFLHLNPQQSQHITTEEANSAEKTCREMCLQLGAETAPAWADASACTARQWPPASSYYCTGQKVPSIVRTEQTESLKPLCREPRMHSLEKRSPALGVRGGELLLVAVHHLLLHDVQDPLQIHQPNSVLDLPKLSR